MIKAIFFDIDGTLLPMNGSGVLKSTIDALDKCKKQGIKIFVATGRPPKFIDEITKIYDFDGYLMANGQYCFNKETVIYERYIPQESFASMLSYIQEHPVPMVCALKDRNFKNILTDEEEIPYIDFKELINENIIQLMVKINEKEEQEFLNHVPGCISQRWNDTSCDIIPDGGGKEIGIDRIIQFYNIKPKETMAFGDGLNDISMLRHVGIGVAMNNARDEVKTIADFITKDACDDGIYYALKHFKII